MSSGSTSVSTTSTAGKGRAAATAVGARLLSCTGRVCFIPSKTSHPVATSSAGYAYSRGEGGHMAGRVKGKAAPGCFGHSAVERPARSPAAPCSWAATVGALPRCARDKYPLRGRATQPATGACLPTERAPPQALPPPQPPPVAPCPARPRQGPLRARAAAAAAAAARSSSSSSMLPPRLGPCRRRASVACASARQALPRCPPLPSDPNLRGNRGHRRGQPEGGTRAASFTIEQPHLPPK
eukprot:scaffold115_cov304-Prasinococcus_capsulatus_cf.AAC.50